MAQMEKHLAKTRVSDKQQFGKLPVARKQQSVLKKRLIANQNTLPKRLDSIAQVTPLKYKVEKPQPQVMSDLKPVDI